jgi:hypothetical protein
MHTTATLHVHPAAASIYVIFETRRLAKLSGCTFVTSKRKTSTSPTRPIGPNDGGHAA